MDNEEQDNFFGYQKVSKSEKEAKVYSVFHDVAYRYDIMNDLMSGGLHRIWKRNFLHEANILPQHKVLDLACGTCDLTALFAKKLQKNSLLVACDINKEMLRVGRNKMLDNNIIDIQYLVANAEQLPLASNFFDRITIGFGLRNVANKKQALAEIYRILKPGGKFCILEFSQPTKNIIKQIYDIYSFNLIPKIGKFITGHDEHYKYLVESIRMHPPQKELLSWMEHIGFENCNYYNLLFGVVAIHYGYKC